MKYIKYLALPLLISLFSSCTKEEVTYQMDPVDQTKTASYQIHFFAPIENKAVNYIYQINVNGETYQNNGSSYLLPYNGVPSGGTNLYYTTAAGKVNMKFYQTKELKLVYDQNIELKPGMQNIFVYDLNAAPIILDSGEMPKFITPSTAQNCGLKFYNFFFENATTPFTDKVQLVIQNRDTKEYENIGTPLSFGECTEWTTPSIVKEVENSSGSEKRYFGIKRIDGKTGADLGFLSYMTNSGKETQYKDILRTLAIGRNYRFILGGTRASGVPGTSMSTWTAQ